MWCLVTITVMMKSMLERRRREMMRLILVFLHAVFFFFKFARGAQLDTADAELKVPSIENPELMTVLLLTPGVRQNYIATHALSTARVIFLVLTSTFLVRSFLLQILSILFDCFCFLANGINRSPCSPAFPYLLSVLFFQ